MNIIEVLTALDNTPLKNYEYGELVCNHINLLIPDDDPIVTSMTGLDVLAIVNQLNDSARLRLYQAKVPSTTLAGTPLTPKDIEDINKDPDRLPGHTRNYLSAIGITATVAAVIIGFVGLMIITQRGGELDEGVIRATGSVLVDILKLVMGQ